MSTDRLLWAFNLSMGVPQLTAFSSWRKLFATLTLKICQLLLLTPVQRVLCEIVRVSIAFLQCSPIRWRLPVLLLADLWWP